MCVPDLVSEINWCLFAYMGLPNKQHMCFTLARSLRVKKCVSIIYEETMLFVKTAVADPADVTF